LYDCLSINPSTIPETANVYTCDLSIADLTITAIMISKKRLSSVIAVYQSIAFLCLALPGFAQDAAPGTIQRMMGLLLGQAHG
jgi:hypothetical protein